ncbi:oxidoreductase [Sinomonas sp. ASV322]|uniref:oxidoreductase n=1 Tax=Sinomonas sp. ASV322 TaxID=3041920 RepID=UPI0027DC66F6|nr:oxidoreductase [Sinomonas sp. ASV322]MDQ4501584.1 oxidoreductase [Sinomonas sp. ASV322]
MPETTARHVALVTGASSGIGAATVRALMAAGFTVCATARRVERMQGLADDGARVLAMDVTEDASMVDGVRRITEEAGRIDVLVNNAGYGAYGSLEDVPIDDARRQFEVNVFGLARLTQLVLPGMRTRGAGTIVNVSSMGGKFYEPLGSWYHATKFAVEGLSDSLRIELRPFGVRVVLIEPGPILSEWSGIARDSLVDASKGTAYEANARKVANVLEASYVPGRASEPEVVARAVVRAVRSKHPAPRYPVGGNAGLILAARKVLPDRVFDAIVGSVYGH